MRDMVVAALGGEHCATLKGWGHDNQVYNVPLMFNEEQYRVRFRFHGNPGPGDEPQIVEIESDISPFLCSPDDMCIIPIGAMVDARRSNRGILGLVRHTLINVLRHTN